MHNFGFKVVDKNYHLLEPILDYAVLHMRPVEIGLYFGDSAALELFDRRLFDTAIPVNAHTSHEQVHAFNLLETEDQLEEHIRLARTLGSAYSILHTAHGPVTLRPAKRSVLMTRLLDNLERAEDLCEKHDYRLHLENVFQPLSFYREFFDGILDRGLSRMHFCFDIGHAKVWSTDTLEDWIGFMQELEAEGIALHFHLHANQGLDDDHLSLAEAAALGITSADGYYNAHGYPGAYWLIEQHFPEAVKVFEVKAEHAISNLESVVAAGLSRKSNDLAIA